MIHMLGLHDETVVPMIPVALTVTCCHSWPTRAVNQIKAC